jgi:two-component system, cell cycle response regulator
MRPTSDLLRLLLVDDYAPERDLYEIALEQQFQILTASNGPEGIAMAIAERPHVIVLDVLMPGMDGWETCTKIKSHPVTADIPVILLTGSDEHNLSQQAVAVGAAAILTKPCPADRLVDRIRSLLELRIEN